MPKPKKDKKIKNFFVEICPNLLKNWKKNKVFNKEVIITKTEVNKVTNKLSIFCNNFNHNCFCDKRVRVNPKTIQVARGFEIK